MTYKNVVMPDVVPVRTDGRGVTWVLCEDCTRILPATRRRGGQARVIPHLADLRVAGRPHAERSAHERAVRRLVWRCQGGGRYGLVTGGQIADVCASCPVAAIARDLRKIGETGHGERAKDTP